MISGERKILLWSYTNIFSYAPRATLARCHLGLPGYRGGRHLWKAYFLSFPNHIRIIWISKKKKKSSTGRMKKKDFLFNQTGIQSSVFFPQAVVLEAKRKKAENHSFLLLVVHLCTLHGFPLTAAWSLRGFYALLGFIFTHFFFSVIFGRGSLRCSITERCWSLASLSSRRCYI